MRKFDFSPAFEEVQDIEKIIKPIIENLGQRIAASKSGKVCPADLIPYLPVSLSIIEDHLDEMVDGVVAFSEVRDGIKVYEFPELFDTSPVVFPDGVCVYSGDRLSLSDDAILAPRHQEGLEKHLLELAEQTAWPSEAVWEHELLFLASGSAGPIRIADIAGHSRMTLRQVKQKLAALAKRGAVRLEVDFQKGQGAYSFPPINYSSEAYARNDGFIRRHPSSLKEELENKVIRSLINAIIILFGCLLVAFAAKVPFPLILLVGLIAAALSARKVFRTKKTVESI